MGCCGSNCGFEAHVFVMGYEAVLSVKIGRAVRPVTKANTDPGLSS
jgi:hypothetical protein